MQEARAKRSLDRLAALVAPRATVVRDGRPRQVDVPHVVPGDLVLVGAGDQVVADGRLRAQRGRWALDESILTGEAEAGLARRRRPGARRLVRRRGDGRLPWPRPSAPTPTPSAWWARRASSATRARRSSGRWTG